LRGVCFNGPALEIIDRVPAIPAAETDRGRRLPDLRGTIEFRWAPGGGGGIPLPLYGKSHDAQSTVTHERCQNMLSFVIPL